MPDPDWHAALAGFSLSHAVDVIRTRVRACPPLPRTDEPAGDPEGVACRRLSELGRQASEDRAAWARARYPAREVDDRVGRMWRRWAAGQVFQDQGRWIELLDRSVTGAFRQAMSSRPLPSDVLSRAIGDLRDALFYQLIGGPERSGFREIAAFVLETAPHGPARPLFAVLGSAARARVAGCVTRRGHWPETIARALPDAPGPEERALRLASSTTPEQVDGWIELHVVMRLVDGWAEDPGDPDRDQAVLRQNAGRSRGRLRAVVADETPVALAEALAALPELAERTRAGARRWAWAWAWESLATGFTFDLDRPVIRPCTTGAGVSPLDGAELAALHGWALLCLLRGRADTLERWSRDGSGDRDGTWGRLLSSMPDVGHARARAALVETWPGWSASVTPAVQTVADLPSGRGLRQAFERALAPWWHPTVPWPRSGFPSMVRNAQVWLHRPETK